MPNSGLGSAPAYLCSPSLTPIAAAAALSWEELARAVSVALSSVMTRLFARGATDAGRVDDLDDGVPFAQTAWLNSKAVPKINIQDFRNMGISHKLIVNSR